MTSEICVMNRLAVVLAADSATTVTHTTDEGAQQRYFKGANKIFQLSHHNPVGLMIYDSANILSVPWEIVVKEFRTELKDKSFNELQGYAEEFFTFLQSSVRLFPEQIQRQRLLEGARTVCLTTVLPQDKESSEAARRTASNEALAKAIAENEGKPLANGLSKELLDETVAGWKDELVAMNAQWFEYLEVVRPDDADALAAFGIGQVFRNPGSVFGTTGLVFAGFGDHDIFPVMAPYWSQGIVAGHHVAEKRDTVTINHDMPAWLSAFAQTSMSDTFTLGVSLDVYSSLLDAVSNGLSQFAEELLEACGFDGDKPETFVDIVSNARKAISQAVLDRAGIEHAQPMRRVLSVLPVDEMAELAETLINLQSLKEKVTKPSETVGGPIDVAVITRSEGLVWLRRKHFFDPAINSRFMQRQNRIYQ